MNAFSKTKLQLKAWLSKQYCSAITKASLFRGKQIEK